ncbi:hypothetical protein [Sporomusa acidovorans]|uniref:Uncharacterized protein n=1 Tax=Sporomusa acidovorans (strain ATCC 49682 / DSM 3132 / Mol) TaxID=1123286 RepID=A0ABZ3J829_SPOA4|nr:hypothetical protein [Sporomusa acidovorans]OZC24124.1 hypothetical protein SPACI_02250 [Sporomusa acidovorans DSM 3132]SDF71766.1 hypothetical protein SAMN04488499_107110 [Sporomusa acidovorans]
MKRIAWLCFLLLFSFAMVVSAETTDMTGELFRAQTISNMQTGIYAIPEETINSYFNTYIADNPKIKASNLAIQANNKIVLTTTVANAGTIRVHCTVKQFHFDKDNAFLTLHIDKKELLGHSIASWFMNQMSLGFLADIYGNPLAQANIDSKVHGNTVDINLKPFAQSLFSTGIGQAIGDQLMVSNVTTDEKIIYLHTNLALSLLK